MEKTGNEVDDLQFTSNSSTKAEMTAWGICLIPMFIKQLTIVIACIYARKRSKCYRFWELILEYDQSGNEVDDLQFTSNSSTKAEMTAWGICLIPMLIKQLPIVITCIYARKRSKCYSFCELFLEYD